MLYSIVSGDFLTMCAVCCVVGEGTWWREDVHAIVTTVWLNKYKKVCVCVCVCVLGVGRKKKERESIQEFGRRVPTSPHVAA